MPRLSTHTLDVGTRLAERTFEPTAVSLFLYNAAIWNAHRIHYDKAYTTEVERYPGIVVDGPLQGDWLSQVVTEWLGDQGELVEFEYSNRRAAYLGERLCSGGVVTTVDQAAGTATVELYIKNAEGTVISPGRAVVRLRA
jgi:3-methylfumaryl-CoA hydratase